jgi:hypothetical protein
VFVLYLPQGVVDHCVILLQNQGELLLIFIEAVGMALLDYKQMMQYRGVLLLILKQVFSQGMGGVQLLLGGYLLME